MADRRATSSELYAMSKHLAVKCAQSEVAYLNCKDKYSHPEDCLQEAKAVIKCSEHLCVSVLVGEGVALRRCVVCVCVATAAGGGEEQQPAAHVVSRGQRASNRTLTGAAAPASLDALWS